MNAKEAFDASHMVTYPFHNLYDNRHFSLYDLVYVSEFEFEICIRMDGNLYFCQELTKKKELQK